MNTPERPEDRPNDRPEIDSGKTPTPSDPVSSPSPLPGAPTPATSPATAASRPVVEPMPGPARPVPPKSSKPEKPDKPAKLPREPRKPRRGGSAFAPLLALLALIVAAYVGWQQWQQQRADRVSAQSSAALQNRVDTLATSVQTLRTERVALSQQVGSVNDASRNLQAAISGQNERLRGLEGAVAKLSQQTLSGHDAMLLDETDALLRMGAERYRLFHDARGAAAAYASAGQALSAVNDEAFAGVRESVKQEREALLKSRAANQQAALAQLDQLRSDVANWPQRQLDAPPSKGAEGGFWARIGHALSSVVSVERDNGAPMAVADARLARELTGLDLAQAQAALLGHDADGYLGALQRVKTSLAQQFDSSAAAVREASATVAGLISNGQPAAAVTLGGALEQLRNLRTVHALTPDSSAPAAATSAPFVAAPAKSINAQPSATDTVTPAKPASVPAAASSGATP